MRRPWCHQPSLSMGTQIPGRRPGRHSVLLLWLGRSLPPQLATPSVVFSVWRNWILAPTSYSEDGVQSNTSMPPYNPHSLSIGFLLSIVFSPGSPDLLPSVAFLTMLFLREIITTDKYYFLKVPSLWYWGMKHADTHQWGSGPYLDNSSPCHRMARPPWPWSWKGLWRPFLLQRISWLPELNWSFFSILLPFLEHLLETRKLG